MLAGTEIIRYAGGQLRLTLWSAWSNAKPNLLVSFKYNKKLFERTCVLHTQVFIYAIALDAVFNLAFILANLLVDIGEIM